MIDNIAEPFFYKAGDKVVVDHGDGTLPYIVIVETWEPKYDMYLVATITNGWRHYINKDRVRAIIKAGPPIKPYVKKISEYLPIQLFDDET